MKLKALVFATLFAGCLTALPLAAQEHAHDKGRNGGQVADAGDYHVEAVATGGTLVVHLTDHDDDKPVPTKGFKGLAILVIDGKPQRIALAPQGENMLTGTSAAGLTAPIRGAIQITTGANATVQAKF